MRSSFSNFLYLLLLWTLLTFQSVYAKQVYSWSVVPQFTGSVIHRDWVPVLKHIEKSTGYRFELKFYDSIPGFEKGFLDGEPDFAYMNPYHAVMANEAQGYDPIIRSSKRLLTGILVARKDNPIDNLDALNGKKIAFPSPNAFAAALYMRALLREKEGINFTPVYTGTHSNAYRQTLAGRTIATGGVARTLRKERFEIQQSLKVIYKTPGSASHPLAVHRRVPDAVKIAVQKALLELNITEKGRGLLKAVLLSDSVKADYGVDYKPLKSLNLEKYLVSTK